MRRAGARALLVLASLVAAHTLGAHTLGAQARTDSAPPSGSSGGPAIVGQGRIDARQDVNFAALVAPQTVYVGQQATYQIGVFLSEAVRQRLRRNPEFVPPDVRSMVAYDLPTPSRPLLRIEDGREFDVHVFQRALFPLTAGSHEIAPARLSYALPLSQSFFSREESHSARTAAFTIIARDPPDAGRPADWQGAVGRLSLAARVDTGATRVGTPVTVTVDVSGVGNVALLPRPAFTVDWAEAIPGAEHVAIDSTSSLVQGRKTFEWVVTPKRSGAHVVPELRYPYWNPYTERYEVALSRSIPVQVGDGTIVSAPSSAATPEQRLPLRREFRGALSVPISTSSAFLIVLALAPLPALALGASSRPRRVRPVTPRDRLTRLAREAHTPADLRRAFAAAIAERTGIGAAVMTDARSLVRALRRNGVSEQGAQRAQLLLAELDRAVYGGSGALPGDAGTRAVETLQQVDEEAIPHASPSHASRFRARSPRGRAMIVVALLASLTTGVAIADEALDLARFQRGVDFYERGFQDAAMREFNDIVRRSPRAADAWANLGTAAWEANDTATAVIGWQRALRLEPLAEDMRSRLEQTPGFRAGLLGDIPPVPTDGLGLVAGALWLAGWGALAWLRRRPLAPARRVAWFAVAAGACCGMLTVALHDITSGRKRVVVVAPESLRASPALAADHVGDVIAGETARTGGVQGGWTRLRFPDGRSGWIETRRVSSLDVDRAL